MWVVGLALLSLANPVLPASEDHPEARILLLHSYHPGFYWTDNLTEGVQEALAGADIDLVVEYMDTKRHDPAKLTPRLAGLYQQKYAGSKFDVVVAADNNALNFMREHRRQIFGNPPVVFCGINTRSETLPPVDPGMTGIFEVIDIAGTLDMALALHPRASRVGVIVDDTETGKLNLRRLEALMPRYAGRIEFRILDQLEPDDLSQVSATATEADFMLHLNFNRDVEGRAIDEDTLVPLIVRAAGCPVYSMWEHRLEQGAAGGVVISGRAHGKVAGDVALDVIRGKSPEDIPPRSMASNVPMFRYAAFDTYGLSARDLPPDVVITGKPLPFYQRRGKWVLDTAIVFAFLAGVFFVLYVNVIRRQQAERSLAQSQSRYQNLFDSSHDGMVRVDMDERILDANPAFLRITGYARRDLDAMAFHDFFPGEADAGEWTLLRNQLVEAGFVDNHERRIVRRDGSAATVMINGVTRHDDSGEAIGVWWNLRDISVHREMEEALHDSEEQLAHSQKLEAVGRLAGGVAHDFNNLLTSILGYSQLAQQELPGNSPVFDDIEEVIAAGERAKNLTGQLLAFAQKDETNIRPLDINTVVLGMDSLLRRTLGEDIEMVTVLEDDPATIEADHGQLEQIVMNLAVNARDAMPQGGTLRITTSNVELDENFVRKHAGTAPGLYVKLTIADNGGGMSEDVRRNIFEPFFTTKEKGKGTGLGLSTVYGIIRRYCGFIVVESEPTAGARFDIYFAAVDSDTSSDGLPVIIEDDAPHGTETILVVEDEMSVLRMTTRMLQGAGYKVLTSGHGLDAITLTMNYTHPIHLVLSDVVMPKMSGPEMVRRLGSIRTDFDTLFMSGFTNIPVENSSEFEPGSNLLKKPFTRSELLHAVRNVLDTGAADSSPPPSREASTSRP